MNPNKNFKIKRFLYFLGAMLFAGGTAYVSYKLGFADGRKESVDTEEVNRLRVENKIWRREIARSRIRNDK